MESMISAKKVVCVSDMIALESSSYFRSLDISKEMIELSEGCYGISNLGIIIYTKKNDRYWDVLLNDCSILVVRSKTKVDKKFLDLMKKIKVVIRAGAGLDNIDLEAAKEKNIQVFNTPGANSNAAAELTISHILSLARGIIPSYRNMKKDLWKSRLDSGIEVFGKTLGLFGYGHIGKKVAEKAVGLGMKVVFYDPFVESCHSSQDISKVSFDECLSCDFVSLHLPLTEKTYHICGFDFVKKMKEGSFLINCGRGGLVDEKVAFDALLSGHLRGLALDVFENEPEIPKKYLNNDLNLLVSPHIGASTEEASVNVVNNVLERIVGLDI